MTAKRRADNALYRKKRAGWLIGKSCARCGRAHTPGVFELTVQHMKGRIGALLLNEEFWLPMCWEPCHRMADENPLWALEHGYALRRVGGAA